MSKTIQLRFISDSGHGWLSVANDQIRQLGIADQISRYSYQSKSRSYLEEDCDADVFLKAAADAGWEVVIERAPQCKGEADCRRYASYDPHWITHPIGVGSVVSSRGVNLTIDSKRPGYFLASRTDGVPDGPYWIPFGNPLRHVSPPVESDCGAPASC